MRALTAAPTAADLRAHVERLDGAAAAGRLAVAVSGGADSLALLKLSAEAFPGRLEAVTVDHGLRPTSAEEAQGVGAIAASLGVPHAILRLHHPLEGPGLQAAARAARYRAMAGHAEVRGVTALLTAHHADDQAETLLMRLNRGSGLSGLAGVRERQVLHGLLVLRPLLGVRRQALRLVLEGTGWPIAEDPANADERFDRARVRRLLARAGLDASAAARSAACLAEAEAALCWAVERSWDSRVELCQGECRLDLEGLPDEISRRLLARALESFGAFPRGAAVARLLARGGGTLAGLKATCRGSQWRLAPAPARGRGRG
ncbi:tRNA lysidine(34) synthetase TilS [Thermaurantiacus sp.]